MYRVDASRKGPHPYMLKSDIIKNGMKVSLSWGHSIKLDPKCTILIIFLSIDRWVLDFGDTEPFGSKGVGKNRFSGCKMNFANYSKLYEITPRI